MISIDRYQELQDSVNKKQQKLDRSKGALSQMEERLKNEFDCDSVEQAEKLLKKLEKEAAVAEKAFQKSFEAFEKEWDDAQ